MNMTISFPGGARVDAHFGHYEVRTDQPPAGGGDGSAPTPFAHFLASIGTCAGIYVLGFCRERGIPTDGIRLVESATADPETGLVDRIDIAVELPASFPEKYKAAVLRAADHCAVKRHFEHPPKISLSAKTAVLSA